MSIWVRASVLGALVLILIEPALGKPIAFARGQTAMAEYGGTTMTEAQYFYAPKYWWSFGAGRTTLEADDGSFEREIIYGRANLLVKRWNMPSAQANVFLWGGLGEASGDTFAGDELTRNAGFQLDYETRRVYGSFKTDLFESDAFSHRIDTLQLGLAPYLHDYDTLAGWVVVQGRRYTGGISEGTEAALLIRLFKGGVWVEAGVTEGGPLQAMFMVNF